MELASPPTWVASISSALVGGVAAIALSSEFPLVWDLRTFGVWALMLIIAVLMQSATNSINDYKDFMTGLDTTESILDETDASIVYNEFDPKHARSFAIALLFASAVLGLIVVLLSGWPILVAGLVAACIVVLYSAGPKPISYLPLGEIVSGVTMGGIITSATYYAMTLTFSPFVLTVCVPPIITIGLIMMANNTCDIQRDKVAGRRTLPVLLGLDRSMRVERVLAWANPAYMVVWVAAFDVIFWRSFLLLAVDAAIALGLYFLLRSSAGLIGDGPYNLVNRRVMMTNITGFCRTVNLAWMAILLICLVVGSGFFIV